MFEGFSLLSTRFTEPLASLNSSQNNNICNIINAVNMRLTAFYLIVSFRVSYCFIVSFTLRERMDVYKFLFV